MRPTLCSSTFVLLAILALPAASSAAAEAPETPLPLFCPADSGDIVALEVPDGKQGAIAASECPAFCSSHSDCETACPDVSGVFCDFSTWTCESDGGGGSTGGGGDECPAFCSSHSDCETACPEVSGVFCDFSTWTCAT